MMNQTSSNETVVYATFMQRMYAFIVDCLVFIPLNLLSNFNTLSIKSLALSVLITVVWWIYKPVMEWKFGATLGKMVLKIRVVDEELKAISFNQAALRFLPYFAVSMSILFSTFALFATDGFYDAHTFEAFQLLEYSSSGIDTTQFTIFFFIFSCSSIMLDEKKQAVHDRISQTYCIMTNTKLSLDSENILDDK
jgi:uncharacterized RDD family membrane protein YckC